MVPTSNLLARNKTEEIRRDALLIVGKPFRLASGTPAAQEVRRDASLTVGKPSRLASGVLAAQEVRRDALLTVGKPSRLAFGHTRSSRGKAGRLTYGRQAVPACFGACTQPKRKRRDA